MTADTQIIRLGAVVSAHGIRGQFKVKPFTSEPMAVADYGEVLLENGQKLSFTAKSVAKGLVLCASPDVTTREQAEALKGLSFSVDRDRLPAAEEDEIYHADLIGLEVRNQSQQHVGNIVGIHNFGAGEIVEISTDSSKSTMLLPFYPPFLQQIDIPNGFIIIAHDEA